MNSRISYRPDIDGLRAIAVLSVVFYHAGFNIFSGGYVGVDVFFVISGYLITTIIAREIEAGEFSLVRFYERRIRRIFPALYVVIPLVLLAASIFYSANNFAQTSQGAMAATLFMSNVLFWTESGYFAAPTTLKPLLHTWSLAVEEQFYIVFPLLMLLIMRYVKKWYKPVLGAFALTSFLLNIYYTKEDPSAAFYFFHLRAWELLVGGLLAINIVPISTNRVIRNLCSLGGLAGILVSVFLYTKNTAFPGASALLPTLGTALIIFSGINGDSFVGKILSLPPLVFVGKISYSLYLWHWPIISFGKYCVIQEPTIMEQIIWVAASIALAALSWQFVERPFRSKSFLVKPKIFMAAGSMMLLTFAAAGVIDLNHGMPGFLNNNELVTSAEAEPLQQQAECVNDVFDSIGSTFCRVGEKTSARTFLVWGDSHAAALNAAVGASAKKYGEAGYLIADNMCPPLLDANRSEESSRKIPCGAFNNMVVKYLKGNPTIKTVILAGRWTLSAEGTRYKGEEGPDITLIDQQAAAPGAANEEIFENGIDRTIKTLIQLNRKIVIVLPIPEIGYDVPSSYFIALRTGRDINKMIAPTLEEYLQRNRFVIDLMDGIQNRYHVQLLDPTQALCSQDTCKIVVDGNLLYADSHHLSTFGSLYISNIFDPLFEELSQSPSN